MFFGNWIYDICNYFNVIQEGVVEIWLTSEDTGAYGRDIGVTLPDLLNELIKVIPEGNHNFNGFIIHRFHVKNIFFPKVAV